MAIVQQKNKKTEFWIGDRVCFKCKASYKNMNDLGQLQCREHCGELNGKEWTCCLYPTTAVTPLQFYSTPTVLSEKLGCIRSDHVFRGDEVRSKVIPYCLSNGTAYMPKQIFEYWEINPKCIAASDNEDIDVAEVEFYLYDNDQYLAKLQEMEDRHYEYRKKDLGGGTRGSHAYPMAPKFSTTYHIQNLL